MKKYTPLFFVLIILSCNQADNSNASTKDSTVVIATDTIPAQRKTVNTDAAASYSEKIPDELNNWKFAVSLYETKKTFQYLVRVQYKELRITDSLEVPNFGVLPKVEIRKGKEPLSCILGFLDKKLVFKEYKLVRIKDDQLIITTLNHYSVGIYHMKVGKSESP